MSKNYEDYGYEDENNETNYEKSPVAKKALIVILIVIAIFLILYLIKGCSGNSDKPISENTFNYEEALLKGGKTYFENNMSELPNSVGECNEVKLDKLIEKGLVDPEKFSSCNLTSTYLRVCVLSNGNKQYTPWLTCSNKSSESEYDTAREGSLANVIADSTYVSFEFLPQILKAEGATYGDVEELWKDDIKYSNYKTLSTTNYYRYRDKLYKWDLTTNHYYTRSGETTDVNQVKEYYLSAPDNEHKMYGSATNEGYKWYKAEQVKVYWLGANGAPNYSPVKVDGYPYQDEVGVNLYLQRYVESTYEPYKYYLCAVDATSSTIVGQLNIPCGKGSNSNFTYERDIVYSCTKSTDNRTAILAGKVEQGEKCPVYSEWKALRGSTCNLNNEETCMMQTVYKWYKFAEGNRTYYPSGSGKASDEKVYYTSSPADGYVKDDSTRTKVYKWFRTTTKTSTDYTATPPSGYSKTTKTSDYKWTDWSEWTTDSVKVNDGRDRSIETKTKIKLQQIIGTSEQNWTSLTENDKYVSFDEMITIFKNNKFDVNTMTDINNTGEIRYQVKMLLRNKKETNR